MGLFNVGAGGEPNPLLMQLAQQMMSQGTRSPQAFSRTGGLASGITSAGNSLLGAMMMKPQLKAMAEKQKKQQEMFEKLAAMIEGGSAGGTGSKLAAASPEGQALMKTLSQIPGMSFKDAAGAKSGQAKAAPAAASGMPAMPAVTSRINPQARELIGTMLSSGVPAMQEQGMELLVKSMPAPSNPKDRLVVAGGALFDAWTMEQIQLKPNMKAEYDLGDGKLIFDYGSDGYVLMPNLKDPELETYKTTDQNMSKELGIEVVRERIRNKNTKEDLGPALDKNGNWPVVDYQALSQGTEGVPFFGKTGIGEIEKQLIAGEVSLAKLDRIDEALDDESYLTDVGRMRGFWINLKDKSLKDLPIAGQFFSVSDDDAEFLGDFTNFHVLAMDSLNKYIKMITGAQMSENEADRIRDATADAQNQGPLAFRAAMRASRTSIETSTRVYKEMKNRLSGSDMSDEEAHIRAQAAADQESFSAWNETYDRELKNLAKQDRGAKIPSVKTSESINEYLPPGVTLDENGRVVKRR